MLNLITEVWKQVENMTTYPSVFDKYTQLDTLFGSMGAMAMFNLWRTLVNTRIQEGLAFQPQFQTILDTRNTLSKNRMSVSDMQLAFIIWTPCHHPSLPFLAPSSLLVTPTPSILARS
jgi:hypothetical protein